MFRVLTNLIRVGHCPDLVLLYHKFRYKTLIISDKKIKTAACVFKTRALQLGSFLLQSMHALHILSEIHNKSSSHVFIVNKSGSTQKKTINLCKFLLVHEVNVPQSPAHPLLKYYLARSSYLIWFECHLLEKFWCIFLYCTSFFCQEKRSVLFKSIQMNLEHRQLSLMMIFDSTQTKHAIWMCLASLLNNNKLYATLFENLHKETNINILIHIFHV